MTSQYRLLYMSRVHLLGETIVYTCPAGHNVMVKGVSFGNPNPGTLVKANVHLAVPLRDLAVVAAVSGLGYLDSKAFQVAADLNPGDRLALSFISGTQVDVNITGLLRTPSA